MSERKPEGERSNRKPYVFPNVTLIEDGQLRGPEPEDEWGPEAKEFWAWLRTSAQARQMHTSDWFYMKLAMKAYDACHKTKTVVDKTGEVHELPLTAGELRALMAEFRTYTAPFGLTHQDRIRYGINIIKPGDAVLEAENITESVAVDYRSEL